MNPDLLRYMTAYVAMHCKDGSSVLLWPIKQIVDAFSILPPPPIDFSVWAGRITAMTAPDPENVDSEAVNGGFVAMAESAKDLQAQGILTIQDA